MSLKEKLQDRLEGHIADTLLTLALAVIAAITYFADWLLPERLIQSLGTLLSAQILIGLGLTTILLATWVAYLRFQPKPEPISAPAEPQKPRREFNPQLGFWKNLDDGLDYCAKCDVTPLSKKEAGWYCVKCHHLYDDPEFQRRRKEERERKRREEDELVRRHHDGNSWMS